MTEKRVTVFCLVKVGRSAKSANIWKVKLKETRSECGSEATVSGRYYTKTGFDFILTFVRGSASHWTV